VLGAAGEQHVALVDPRVPEEVKREDGRVHRPVRQPDVERASAGRPVAEQILRAELRRLATHIGVWDRELRANKAQLRQRVAQVMPASPGQPGVGPMSAVQLLVSWSHSGRFRSLAAFAALAGVSPLKASSGKITRHRLNP
jgi:transposase